MSAIEEALHTSKKDFDEIRGDSRRILLAANSAVIVLETALSSWKESVTAVEAYVKAGKDYDLPRLEGHMEPRRLR